MSDAPLTTPKNPIEAQLGPDDVGAQGFLKWLKLALPDAYRAILPDVKKLQAQARMNGFGAFGDGGVSTDVPAGAAAASTSWTDTLSKLITAWGQYKLTDAQLDVAKQAASINLQRAQQGLAPLPYTAEQMGISPTVNVGLSGSTSNLVMYGAIGVGLLLVLNMFKPRRA